MTGKMSTEPVLAANLEVGDVYKSADGHYYAVTAPPKSSHYPEEYSSPDISVPVTEVNQHMAPVAKSEITVHSPDAVLDVLTPRPSR